MKHIRFNLSLPGYLATADSELTVAQLIIRNEGVKNDAVKDELVRTVAAKAARLSLRKPTFTVTVNDKEYHVKKVFPEEKIFENHEKDHA